MPVLSKDTIKAMESFFKKINKIFPDFKIKNGEFAMVTSNYTTIVVGKFKEKFDLTLFNIDVFLSFLNMYEIHDDNIQLLYNDDSSIKEDNDDVLEYVFRFDNKVIILKKPNIIMSRDLLRSLSYDKFSSDENTIVKFKVNKKEFINSLKAKFVDTFYIHINNESECILDFQSSNNTIKFDIQTQISFLKDKDYIGKTLEFNIDDVSILTLSNEDVIEIKINETEGNNSILTLLYDVKLLDENNECVLETATGHVGTII